MTNIDDKIRKWQDAREGGGAGDLRRALGEALDQIRLNLEPIRQAVASEPAPAEPDLTAAHYLEVCAKLDALTASVEESKRAGRKRVDLTVLEEILK
jgi:hypothetical protein